MTRAAPAPDVVHVLPDKLGGVVTTVENLLRCRPHDALPQRVVLTHNRLERDTRYARLLGADSQTTVQFALPLENVRSVLARLAAAIPYGPGVLVANDWIELAMATRHDTGRAVVQVVHGDYEYYYDLAAKHDAIVDLYIGASERITERLRERLPHRSNRIIHFRHGIELPKDTRTASTGPLRLLFIGRLDRDKGVFDLPVIDAELLARGVAAHWTIVGDGPEGDALRAAWPTNDRVKYLGPVPRERIPGIAARNDVFVLPTRAEGMPLVVLEAMAAGLACVVSDLPSGIPELVIPGETGYRPAVGDSAAFAESIARIARHVASLERMSKAARALVEARFEAHDCARDYHALFARWAELRRPRPAKPVLHYGSRLDQPWIPNVLVYALRAGIRRLRGRAPIA